MKMHSIVWIFILLATLCLIPVGRSDISPETDKQAQITVGPNVQVSKAHEKRAHAEVLIAAHASHPGHLLAGSIIQLPEHGQSVIAYWSSDNGTTWQPTLEKRATQGGPWFADPAVAFGPDGAAYFAGLRTPPDKDKFVDISFSRDAGKTWQASTLDSKDQPEALADRPFLAVDGTRGRFSGRVYCNFSPGGRIALCRSGDHGKTFDCSCSLRVHNGRPGAHIGPSAVLSDGSVVVPYHVRVWSGEDRRVSLRLTRSLDGGASLLEEQTVLVHEYPVGIPMLAADPGSKDFRDRLYLVWSEKTSAGIGVRFIVSKDKGITWSQPLDLREYSAPGQRTNHDTFLPSVAVNSMGIVAVAWYDADRDQACKPRCHFRLRMSLDGGQTWLPSVRVSDVTSTYQLRHAVEGE